MELEPNAQSPSQKENFVNTSNRFSEKMKLNFTRSVLVHTRVFVN